MTNIRVLELEPLGIRVLMPQGRQEAPALLPEEKRWYIHSHQFFELHIIESGRRLYRTEDRVFPLEAGQFCLFAPGVYHTPIYTAESVETFGFSFELMKQPAAVRDWLEQQSKLRPVWVGDADTMLQVIDLLRQQNRGRFAREALETAASLLLLQLARSLEEQSLPPTPVQQDRNELRGYLMDDFFHQHFHLPNGEAVLARQLGVSRRQLDRILKKRYGKSFREKLLEMRLQVACDLLRSSEKTVAEIAECVGYSTPSNFTVFFKAAAGMTPLAYRNRKKQPDRNGP